MFKKFTYKYWQDGNWLVGQLNEIDGVFSQGQTVEELEVNLTEAFALMLSENKELIKDLKVRELELEV